MTMDCRTQLASLALGELEKGDFLMATKILTTGIRLEPNNHELYFDRSICHHKLGDFQASLDDANTAIRLNPDDFNIHYQKGLALVGLSRIREAITSFKKSIELRARQDEAKLSDIWKLLRDSSHELKQHSHNNNQALNETVPTVPVNNQQSQHHTSSISSTTGQASKRLHPSDSLGEQQHHFIQNKIIKSRDATAGTVATAAAAAAVDTVIDVDDSSLQTPTPSSSMPAISQQKPSTSTAKDDSYSAKYKRLRRDRERARRGTSKLCTIKPSDLEELPSKGFMRVIAPIDGWLYSGQLSIEDKNKQYVIKLDGDPSGSNYLFNQDTILNDVIKEVRVESVSELRKGARICCYWSRQYKCLSTGVVTSRTFEATKSLVSVKYDNGDLSALPLEDLRLLPPDYPKYMSNCDPLLLARNGNPANMIPNMIADSAASQLRAENVMKEEAMVEEVEEQETQVNNQNEDTDVDNNDNNNNIGNEGVNNNDDDDDDVGDRQFVVDERQDQDDDDDDVTPTKETLDYITSEITLDQSNSVEYLPWKFEGPPKRIKKNGRIYRDSYSAIRRGNEVIRIGDSAELMTRDELPFIAKIEAFWATGRGEMRVRVSWYYRLIETESESYNNDGKNTLHDGENALFETDHVDENDVQSIYRSTRILTWTDYENNYLGHVNKNDDNKIFYLAGYYDPVRRIKHLRTDVKEAL